jgi:sirohydrochlorin ferrochelatase
MKTMSEAEQVEALKKELAEHDHVQEVFTEPVGSLGYRATATLKGTGSVTGGGTSEYTALVNLKTAVEAAR